MRFTKTGLVCFDKVSKKIIGLDEASGGYPWLPDNLQSIKVWEEKDRTEVERYAASFTKEQGASYGFDLEVRSVLIEVTAF